MTTYAGISLTVLTDAQGWLPKWQRKTYISRAKPIGTSRENLQFGGRGNHVIAINVRLTSAADFATLTSYENDGTARALNDLLGDSVNYSAVYLMEVKNVRQLAWVTVIEAECTFERSG